MALSQEIILNERNKVIVTNIPVRLTSNHTKLLSLFKQIAKDNTHVFHMRVQIDTNVHGLVWLSDVTVSEDTGESVRYLSMEFRKCVSFTGDGILSEVDIHTANAFAEQLFDFYDKYPSAPILVGSTIRSVEDLSETQYSPIPFMNSDDHAKLYRIVSSYNISGIRLKTCDGDDLGKIDDIVPFYYGVPCERIIHFAMCAVLPQSLQSGMKYARIRHDQNGMYLEVIQ